MAKIEVTEWLDGRYSNLAYNIGKFMDAFPTSERPHLATILVGNRKDSETYVKNKEKSIYKACMTSETIRIEDGTPIVDIAAKIAELNDSSKVNGILVQLPLNREFYTKKDEDLLISMISPLKDVDGLTLINQGKLFMGEDQKEFLTPCTPTGIIALLKEKYVLPNKGLDGANITVIGRSQLLGNSLAQMLMRENANVTMLHSKSVWEMSDYLAYNTTDIICLCAGSPNLLSSIDLEPYQSYTIIDAAINIGSDGKLRGDICKEDYSDFDNWCDDKRYTVDYTTVPGGVGPITTFTLAYNLYKATCLQNKLIPENI